MKDKILAEAGTVFVTQETLDRYGERLIRAINGLSEDAEIVIIDKEGEDEKLEKS